MAWDRNFFVNPLLAPPGKSHIVQCWDLVPDTVTNISDILYCETWSRAWTSEIPGRRGSSGFLSNPCEKSPLCGNTNLLTLSPGFDTSADSLLNSKRITESLAIEGSATYRQNSPRPRRSSGWRHLKLVLLVFEREMRANNCTFFSLIVCFLPFSSNHRDWGRREDRQCVELTRGRV